MNSIEGLIARMEQMERTLGGLYLPTPAVAEKQRPRRPVRLEQPATAPSQVGVGATVERNQPCWVSRALETHGFTRHELHLTVDVLADDLNALVADLGNQPLMTARLEGAFGSVYCELAVATLNSLNGRTGRFVFPALARTSLSLSIRASLTMWDIFANIPAPLTRNLTFKVDGQLVSGYEY